jgi:beta-N-acetylhexosaminidase
VLGPRTLLPVLLAGALAGCTAAPAAEPAVPQAPRPSPSRRRRRACPAPLERRAAAVLVVGLPGVTSADDPLARSVADLGVGGVFLSHTNVRTAAQVRSLADGLRARAARPLLVSTDEEGGRVAVTRALVGRAPSPRRLAERSTPDEVRGTAAALGSRLAALGVDLDLAPVLDLDAGPAGGIVGTGPSAPTRSARRRTAWPSPAGSTTPG